MPRLTMAERYHSKTLMRKPDTSGVVPNYMQYNEIDWKSLSQIGAGSYNVVFRNNRYAVKIGNVTEDDAESLARLSKYNLGIPVYGYWSSVIIPEWFIEKFRRVRSYNQSNSFDYYLNHENKANVLIVARAKPAVPHKDWETFRNLPDSDPKAKKVSADIKELYDNVRDSGFYWSDNHEGNFGYWRGKPVVLDV